MKYVYYLLAEGQYWVKRRLAKGLLKNNINQANLWTGLDWTGLDWNGLDWTGLDWTELGWTGLDWTDLDWTGLYWTGLDWTGLDWAGLDWTGREVKLRSVKLRYVKRSVAFTTEKCRRQSGVKSSEVRGFLSFLRVNVEARHSVLAERPFCRGLPRSVLAERPT